MADTGRDSDKFMLRLPDGMRDRIKAAAEANNRSMNAEIVETLEKVYPPKSIDVQTLAEFLNGISTSFIADSDREAEEAADYIAEINNMLANTKHPFTVEVDMGMIKMYPYASPKKTDPSED